MGSVPPSRTVGSRGGGGDEGDLGDVASLMALSLGRKGIGRAPSMTLCLRRTGVGGVSTPLLAGDEKEEEEPQQPPEKRIRKW